MSLRLEFACLEGNFFDDKGVFVGEGSVEGLKFFFVKVVGIELLF